VSAIRLYKNDADTEDIVDDVDTCPMAFVIRMRGSEKKYGWEGVSSDLLGSYDQPLKQ